MARIPRILPLIAVAIGGVVAVRAIGVAPGLFEGAKAWAEDSTAAAAGPAPKPTLAAACALTPEQLAQQAGISPAELKIIQSLSQRRTELDARDQDFATTLPLMVAAEQKLDAKVQALEALKAEMKVMLGQVDEREKAEIDRLVQVYSAMRPKEAAPVLATLEDRVRLPVAAAMRPRTLAAIMAQMTPAQARELTEKLAARFQAQQMAARAVAAEAATPAAQPAPTPAAATPNATPEAAPAAGAAQPRARPAASRPATRPQARPAARPAANPAAAPAPAGPQPYRPSDAPNAQPRQTVQ